MVNPFNDTVELPDNSLNDYLLSSFSNCSALSIFTSVTRMPGLPLWVSKTMLLFPSLKTLTASKSCRSAHCFCSITVHKHSLTSVTSLHCFFQASHKILSHVSASERTKYNFTQPFKNRFLTGADTNTQMLWKIMTLALVAKHTWGSNTAHAPSQSRPLKTSSVSNLIPFQTTLVFFVACDNASQLQTALTVIRLWQCIK
jgi:hypothetical protein